MEYGEWSMEESGIWIVEYGVEWNMEESGVWRRVEYEVWNMENMDFFH